MGKRELVIALAFVLVGVVAYQFTAPPPKSGERGLSVSRFFNSMGRSMRGDHAQASFTQHGTFPVHPDLQEIRIADVTKGITIRGESRDDISYDLKVDSTGPDTASALDYAKRSTLTSDDLGSALALSADYPAEGSQVAELTLHVPSRLAARLENTGSAHVHISNVAGVRIDGGSGEVVLEHVTGPVTGQLRAGSLSVNGADRVDLNLQAVTAKLEDVTHTATLTVRSGRCTLTRLAAAIDLDATNTEIVVTAPTGPVHVGASGGHVTITDPARQAEVDGHRTGIDVTLATAVALTLVTTDDELRLRFRGGPPIVALDATASESGRIQIDDPQLGLTTTDEMSRLVHTFGPATAPRVVLRNQHGEIVIGTAK